MYTKQKAPQLTNTWVFVDFVRELKKSSSKSIKLMDRDLVLWRTQSGKISLVNAYCPHMGAHLGQGKICGEVLECPFHKRCFNVEGKSGKGIPIQSYPITLNNGMIYAWFGASTPEWQLPDLLTGFPKKPESKWKIFKYQKFIFKFHSKYMAENGVDASHFKIYHKFCHTYEPAEVLSFTDHSFISKLKFVGYPMLRKLNIPHEIEITTENYGACTLVVNSAVHLKKRSYNFKFLYISAPVSAEDTNYILVMTVVNEPNQKFSFLRKIFEYFYFTTIFAAQRGEFCRESKEIWELKSNPVKPDFNANEHAMQQFNEWYSRFYQT